MKHKHSELIKLWADGAEIQYYSKRFNEWRDIESPIWATNTTYRLKADAWKDKFIKAIREGKTVEVFVFQHWVEADTLHRLVRMDELEHYEWKTEQSYRIKQDPVYVWAYSYRNLGEWYVASKLMTEGEAKTYFVNPNLEYKKLQTI